MVIWGTGMSVLKNAWAFTVKRGSSRIKKNPFFWYVMFIVSIVYIIYKKEPDAFGDTHTHPIITGFPSES